MASCILHADTEESSPSQVFMCSMCKEKKTGEQILRTGSAITNMGQKNKGVSRNNTVRCNEPQSNNYVIPPQMAEESQSADILFSSFQGR